METRECENCYSVLHGTDDCPDMTLPRDGKWRREGRAEKITRLTKRLGLRAEKAEAKRRASRARRRAEKIDPESAPERLRECCRSWAD